MIGETKWTQYGKKSRIRRKTSDILTPVSIQRRAARQVPRTKARLVCGLVCWAYRDGREAPARRANKEHAQPIVAAWDVAQRAESPSCSATFLPRVILAGACEDKQKNHQKESSDLEPA